MTGSVGGGFRLLFFRPLSAGARWKVWRAGGPRWDAGPGARLPAASRRTAAGAAVGAPWERGARVLTSPPPLPPAAPPAPPLSVPPSSSSSPGARPLQ